MLHSPKQPVGQPVPTLLVERKFGLKENMRAVIIARNIPNIGIVPIINQLRQDNPSDWTSPEPKAESWTLINHMIALPPSRPNIPPSSASSAIRR